MFNSLVCFQTLKEFGLLKVCPTLVLRALEVLMPCAIHVYHIVVLDTENRHPA